MKDLFITSSGYICIDSENNTVDQFTSEREGIRNIFVAKEPMTIHYRIGEKEGTVSAKKDDIIVTFYDYSFETPVVVAKSKEWVRNIKKYNECQQKISEKWAEVCEQCAEDNAPKCEG